MTEDDYNAAVQSRAHEAGATVRYPDPDYPHVPYPIIYPAVGSPYYIDPRTGWGVCPALPGTPPMTSEYVRQALEDFP